MYVLVVLFMKYPSENRKEELIRYLLEKESVVRYIVGRAEEELSGKIKSEETSSDIPITIFTTSLSPLESLTRFLKDNKGKKLVEISRITSRSSAALSAAYKNSGSQKFEIIETEYKIPLKEFEDNSDLSILEIVVNYLEKKDMKHSEIAKILGRDVRTIWTLQKRASNKIELRKEVKND